MSLTHPDAQTDHRRRRALLREGAIPRHLRDEAFRTIIRSIPPGRVATYGAVAAAAGDPQLSRAVAHLLTKEFDLPWQRVVGAGGEIRTRGDHADRQRQLLEAEGVTFRNTRVDMATSAHTIRAWQIPSR